MNNNSPSNQGGKAEKKNVMNDPVFQGLMKRQRCSLCEHEFFLPDGLPGAISYKSVLQLRSKWGMDVKKNGRMPSPSLLYQKVDLCVFCSQFFESTLTEPISVSTTQKRRTASIESSQLSPTTEKSEKNRRTQSDVAR